MDRVPRVFSIGLSVCLALSFCIPFLAAETSVASAPQLGIEYMNSLSGRNISTALSYTDPVPIGSFDLLIGFDPRVLSFNFAEPIGDLEQWEYFTYRYWVTDTCGGSCPIGFIRLIGIADMPDGEDPGDVFLPSGEIALLHFHTGEDWRYNGNCVRIQFLWLDCADNILTSVDGDTAYVDQRVQIRYYDDVVSTLWDEEDDLQYPESARPEFMGTPDDCLGSINGLEIIREIDFTSGLICIVDPPEDRGDINLNGVRHESADAVMLANYLIYGPVAFGFGIDPFYDNRMLGSDINDDGLPGTPADLVTINCFLAQGDRFAPECHPSSRINPFAQSTIVRYTPGDEMTVSAETDLPVGAALFIFEHDGLEIGEPILSPQCDHMSIGYSDEDGILRVLVYSMQPNSIDAGTYDLFTIPTAGEGTIELTDAQLSDAFGSVMVVDVAKVGPPSAYSLSQNYPNPFNASTVIRFSLPEPAQWNLQIYNIIGQVIDQFSGQSAAGDVTVRWEANHSPSGIYFYKLEANGFTETRKMVLMK